MDGGVRGRVFDCARVTAACGLRFFNRDIHVPADNPVITAQSMKQFHLRSDGHVHQSWCSCEALRVAGAPAVSWLLGHFPHMGHVHLRSSAPAMQVSRIREELCKICSSIRLEAVHLGYLHQQQSLNSTVNHETATCSPAYPVTGPVRDVTHRVHTVLKLLMKSSPISSAQHEESQPRSESQRSTSHGLHHTPPHVLDPSAKEFTPGRAFFPYMCACLVLTTVLGGSDPLWSSECRMEEERAQAK